ncbi:MAG: hypothetical protein BGN99_17250 [Alphaproteobacteria bacterium 65-37]|nr:MAG: hypothetical protein BGN99_17250 [Alphaproteobacteria bacterium 65-37]
MLRVVLRVAAIVLGSYAASAALVAAATTLLPFTGVARSDAFTLSAALGFLVYLGLGLWAAAERSLVRLFVVLASLTAGGAAVAALIAGGAI